MSRDCDSYRLVDKENINDGHYEDSRKERGGWKKGSIASRPQSDLSASAIRFAHRQKIDPSLFHLIFARHGPFIRHLRRGSNSIFSFFSSQFDA